jgi:parallel beta-helix repeat protein
MCPTIIPAVVLTQNTETIMNKCEIIGNKKYYTTGLLAKYCDLIIKESKIHNNSLGGLHYLSNKRYTFRMIKCRILYNGKAGVTLTGNSSSPILEDNIIDNNLGPGIKIGISNSANIINCAIRFNSYGIEMISCEPLIKHNIIEKNYKHGIYIWSYSSFGGENIRCDGEIYNNLI